MNRRKLLGFAASAAAVALLLAGCAQQSTPTAVSTGDPKHPIQLTLWSTGDLKDQITLFNKTHPRIHANLQVIPNTNYVSKLTTAVSAGNGPDVAGVQYQDLPSVIAAGSLANIAKYVPASTSKKFVSWSWNQVKVGNALYGIPIDSGPLGLYYRKDLFAKYEIAPPKTWAEFQADAQKVQQADPSTYLTAFSPGDTAWFTALSTQNGARWFGTSGSTWKVNLAGAQSTKVADYWQGLITNKLVKPEGYFSDGWNSDLQNGKLLTWISAAWGGSFLASAAPNLSGDWAVAGLPSWDGSVKSANWGGSAETVTKSSKHPAEAATLAAWLWSNPSSLRLSITNHGIFPAALTGLNSSALTEPIKYLGGQSLADVFVPASKSIDGSVQWGPTMSQVITDVGAGFGNAVQGNGTLADALKAAQTKTVTYMKSQGFTAKAG